MTRLFTTPIRYVKVTKGENIRREEYFFVMQNGQEESITGPCIQLHSGNPFVKKIVTKATWKYDKEIGDFITATQNDDNN